MSVIQSRAVEKYLKALKGKDLIYYPTWEEWLEVGSPYPDVAYDKKGVQARFSRNGYDWDIHGCVYTPKKEVDPAICWLVTLGTNGSEGECDICPDGRPGLAAVLAAQGFKVMTFSFPGHFYPPDGNWPMPVEERDPIYLFDKKIGKKELADRNLKCTFDTNMQGVAALVEEHVPSRGLIVTNGTMGARLPLFLKKTRLIGATTIGFAGCDAWRMKWRDKTGADKEKIRGAIEGTKNYVGVSGVFNMSPEDHNGLTPAAFVMVKIEKGDFKLVE